MRLAFAKRSVPALLVTGLAMLHVPNSFAQQAPAASARMVGANINISPRRVVFSASSRADTVIVFNTGSEAATYNVELTDRAMTPGGEIKPLTDLSDAERSAVDVAGMKSAKDLITYTPRRITLAGGESQIIRLRLRPGQQAPGEYRSHLTITAVPAQSSGLTAETAASEGLGKNELSVSLTALFSVSIPVIVREGQLDVSGTISKAQVKPAFGETSAAVSFDFARTGAGSLYGDIQVTGRGNEVLAELKGLGVYPEVAVRHVSLSLNRAPARGEQVKITYTGQDLRKGEVIAAATITAP